MATALSQYADRLDLIAARTFGAINERQINALFRANGHLPLAMREGLAVEIPEADVPPLDYGANFPGWSYPALKALIDDNRATGGDFDARDFNPLDFLTEI